MMEGTDQCFPRKKTKHKIQHDTENDMELSFKKRRLSISEENFEDITCLNMGNITNGMLLLGVITEVGDTGLKMALPGCLTGTVPVMSISTSYSKLLESYMSNSVDSSSEPISLLPSMFKVGETYPSKVVSVEKTSGPLKTFITLSINPVDVNSNLKSSSLHSNMVLNAAVKSIEDRGYVMDIGIPGVLGFMEFANLQINSRISIGQVILTCVESFKSASSKIVSLTSVSKLNRCPKISGPISLNSLLPGMVVKAVVKQSGKKGISLSCMGYEAFVCNDHIPPSISPKKLLATEVTGTILYIHPLSRIIYLTLNFSQLIDKRCRAMHFFNKWDFIQRATVTSADQRNVYFDIGHPTYRGRCSTRNMPQKDQCNSNIGTAARCRVLSIHPLDNIINVGLKQSHLNMRIIKKEELIVGAIFDGKMKKFVKNGMLVTLSQNICGFVRDVHMADGVIGIPEKLYQVGSEVQCRILSVDFTSTPYRVGLTCKKSLCDPRLSILAAYEDAYPGLVTRGVIVKIMPNYILLLFFNNVQGLVPQSDIDRSNLEELYFTGQVVKCRVTLSKPNQKILHVSLKIHEEAIPVKNDMPCSDQLGQVVDVCITAKKKNGFQVQLLNEPYFAFLPFGHLTDNKEHVRDFCDLYMRNDILKVLIFSTTEKIIVTAKYSFIQAAERNLFAKSVADHRVGEIVPAVMKSSNCKKMILELGRNLIGRTSNKVKKSYKSSGFNIFKNMTCMAKVCSIDLEVNEIKLSTCTSEVYDKNPKYSMDALENYLQDREKIKALSQRRTGIVKKMSVLEVGTIVPVVANKVTETSVYCTLQDDVPGHASISNIDFEIKEGQLYSAVVLFADFSSECVEVSFSQHLIKCISKKTENKSSKVKIDQTIKCRVLFVASEFILVALEGHAVGLIAYLPSRRFLNDDHSRSPLYSLGQFHHILIKREYNGNLLGVLKKHNQLYERTVLKTRNDNPSSDIKSGESLRASKVLDRNVVALNFMKSSEAPDLQHKEHVLCSGADLKELPIGSPVKAIITSVKGMQVNLIIDSYLKGRIHIANIGCKEEGQFPLKAFHSNDVLDAAISGYYKRPVHNYLPLGHHKFINYAECSLKRNACDQSKELFPGDTVFGFVKKVGNQSLSLCLSTCQSAEFPYMHMSENPKELRNLKKHFRVGQCVSGSILHLLPNSMLTKLGNWKPVKGRPIAGFVKMVSLDIGLNVKLAHGYTGEIAITDVSDDYATTVHIMSKLMKIQFIQCFVLEVNQTSKTCVLSTRSSRLYSKMKSVVDHEVDCLNLAVGQCLRGFVKLITSSVMHVNIGRKLAGIIELTSENKDLVKELYQVGSMIEVKVISLLHGVTLSFVRMLDDDKASPPDTSALEVMEEFDWSMEMN